MYVTLVNVHVVAGHVQDFVEATRRNHQASIQEPGNLRFDVLQLSDDPCRFLLYEAYASEADAAAHKDTPHYRTWRDAVVDWMASPRAAVRYDGLYPSISSDGA